MLPSVTETNLTLKPRSTRRTTVLDAIRKTRLEKAFSLLKNPRIPLDAIPFQCGYEASPAYLKTYFKRMTGMTMRDWRRQNT